MEFTWQGCDSALAAPLVLDLARLMSAAHRAGRSGPLVDLAYFFKDPLGRAAALRWPSSGRCSARSPRGWPMTAPPDRRARGRRRRGPVQRDLAELVRAPAALSVPGDVVAGAAAAGVLGRRTPVLAASSVCLYWAGMAANDWADRELDARERPGRPIPSGRVSPPAALAVAGVLTAAGLAIAGAGRRPAAHSPWRCR